MKYKIFKICMIILTPIILFTICFTYINSRIEENYINAVSVFNNGEYSEAVKLFDKLGTYKESKNYKTEAEKAIIKNK